MKITVDLNVNINALGLCEALNNLASAMSNVPVPRVTITSAIDDTSKSADKTKSDFNFKLADAAGATDKAENADKPVTAENSEPAAGNGVETSTDKPETDVKKDTPVIALDDVKTKLGALAQAGKQAAVKALIQSFGVAKVSDVPTEKLHDLWVAAEAL